MKCSNTFEKFIFVRVQKNSEEMIDGYVRKWSNQVFYGHQLFHDV